MENIQTPEKLAQTSTWMKSVLTWLASLPRRVWLGVGGVVVALALFVSVRSFGRKQGRLEVINEGLQQALNTADTAKIRLKKLQQERTKIVADIVELAAKQTGAMNETLSDEEVLRRLREKGLVK